MDDKLIVTNRKALIEKYGVKGLATIRKALASLIASDRKRGIVTRVIYLDDSRTMRKMGGSPVLTVSNPRENKLAIDAAFKTVNPDYLMILGAPDVVPHQDLDNPAYEPPDDDDAHAWGDLPYACDVPYSKDPARFIGPTRVVGRLPDLVKAKEPSYFVELIRRAANYRQRSADDYTAYFGLSAKVWQGSTRLSLNNIFGSATKLLLSPRSGPNYRNRELRARMHFINCHGGPASPDFQGQQGSSYPVSLTSRATNGEIVDGAIAAVECCYGAELYDARTLGIDLPICQNYMRYGAYGYLGSTTIAYGPAEDNGAADLICQYFLLNVLDGASIGRAALLARQQFVQKTAQMDPLDLKTIAQFNLLGDPSVHPVKVPRAGEVPKGIPIAEAERFFRAERRSKLRLTGEFLAKTKPTASKRVRAGKLPSQTRTALANIAKAAGLDGKLFRTFAVKSGATSKLKQVKSKAVPSRYHVTMGTPRNGKPTTIKQGIAVVAKELNNRIVGYRIYYLK
jgi:hypothetical protein